MVKFSGWFILDVCQKMILRSSKWLDYKPFRVFPRRTRSADAMMVNICSSCLMTCLFRAPSGLSQSLARHLHQRCQALEQDLPSVDIMKELIKPCKSLTREVLELTRQITKAWRKGHFKWILEAKTSALGNQNFKAGLSVFQSHTPLTALVFESGGSLDLTFCWSVPSRGPHAPQGRSLACGRTHRWWIHAGKLHKLIWIPSNVVHHDLFEFAWDCSLSNLKISERIHLWTKETPGHSLGILGSRHCPGSTIPREAMHGTQSFFLGAVDKKASAGGTWKSLVEKFHLKGFGKTMLSPCWCLLSFHKRSMMKHLTNGLQPAVLCETSHTSCCSFFLFQHSSSISLPP